MQSKRQVIGRLFLLIVLLLSISANIVLVHHYNVVNKIITRLEGLSKFENTQYRTSPYIGFTSFYRAVSYPENVDILFLGDSMTERVEMRYLIPDLEVVSQGIGGDTTEGLLNRLDCAVKCNPKNVVIQIGINDLLQNIDPNVTIQNYKMIVSELQRLLPEANIYIESVYPITHKWESNDAYLVMNNDIIKINQRIVAEICLGGGTVYRCIFDSC